MAAPAPAQAPWQAPPPPAVPEAPQAGVGLPLAQQAPPPDPGAPPGAYPSSGLAPPGLVDAPPPPTGPMVIATASTAPAAKAKRSPLKVGGVVALIAAGALIAGGSVFLLASQSAYDSAKTMGCPTAGSANCSQKADAVSALNTVSEVLYIGGAVAGAGGLTMLLIAPSSGTPGESRVGMALRFRF